MLAWREPHPRTVRRHPNMNQSWLIESRSASLGGGAETVSTERLNCYTCIHVHHTLAHTGDWATISIFDVTNYYYVTTSHAARLLSSTARRMWQNDRGRPHTHSYGSRKPKTKKTLKKEGKERTGKGRVLVKSTMLFMLMSIAIPTNFTLHNNDGVVDPCSCAVLKLYYIHPYHVYKNCAFHFVEVRRSDGDLDGDLWWFSSVVARDALSKK